jgi:hypothetical protein
MGVKGLKTKIDSKLHPINLIEEYGMDNNLTAVVAAVLPNQAALIVDYVRVILCMQGSAVFS